MIPLKFTPLILGVLLSWLAVGCASHSTTLHSGRIEPSKRTRTPEELRTYEGPLSINVDPEHGYGSLGIPQAKQDSFSLFISSEDLAKLEPLDKTLSYEVRFWYYEERWSSDWVWGRGELVSIQNASGIVLDLSRCALHHIDMVRRPVPIEYGLPMREFLAAMRRDFPHPAFTLGGCVVDEGSPKDVPQYVCAKCDAAAKAWTPPPLP